MSKNKKLLLVAAFCVLTTGVVGCSVVEDVQRSFENPSSTLQQTVNSVEPIVDGAAKIVAYVPPNSYTTPVLLGLALVSGVINLIQKQTKKETTQALKSATATAKYQTQSARSNWENWQKSNTHTRLAESTLKAVVNAIEVFDDVAEIKEEVAVRLAEDVYVNARTAKALITSVKETL